MNCNIPLLYARCRGIDKKNSEHECIAHAIRCRAGKVLTFHVHLESGAHYSLLPINKLFHKARVKEIPLQKLQPWDCFSDHAEVVVYDYFRFRAVYHKELGKGEYMFSIDYLDNSFSDYPAEYKQAHLIKLESGHFCVAPNNYLLFQEKTFTGVPSWENKINLVRLSDKDYRSAEY